MDKYSWSDDETIPITDEQGKERAQRYIGDDKSLENIDLNEICRLHDIDPIKVLVIFAHLDIYSPPDIAPDIMSLKNSNEILPLCAYQAIDLECEFISLMCSVFNTRWNNLSKEKYIEVCKLVWTLIVSYGEYRKIDNTPPEDDNNVDFVLKRCRKITNCPEGASLTKHLEDIMSKIEDKDIEFIPSSHHVRIKDGDQG